MTRVRPEFLAKMPTLTEVADVAQGPTTVHRPGLNEPTARCVDEVMGRVVPQVDALLGSQLRALLAPAIEDAVHEAMERCRGPLIEAVAGRLCEVLEQELARKPTAAPVAFRKGHPHS